MSYVNVKREDTRHGDPKHPNFTDNNQNGCHGQTTGEQPTRTESRKIP